MAAFDFDRYVQRYGARDLVLVGTGVLAVLLSFLPYYYGVSARIDGLGSFSAHVNAWHSYAVLGLLLIVVATAVAAVRVFAPSSLPSDLPVDADAAVLGLAGLGTLLVVVRGFSMGDGTGTGTFGIGHISAGVGWSGWLLFLAAVAQVAVAAVVVRADHLRRASDLPAS